MRVYWQQLQSRERWMVAVGVASVLFYLWYVMVDVPLSNAIKNHTEQWSAKKDTFAWMKTISAQPRPQSRLKKVTNATLLAELARQLALSTLKPFPYQLRQSGPQEIELGFEVVPYTLFLQWLWSMTETYAIVVKSVMIERGNVPGLVKVKLALSNP